MLLDTFFKLYFFGILFLICILSLLKLFSLISYSWAIILSPLFLMVFVPLILFAIFHMYMQMKYEWPIYEELKKEKK